MPLKILPDKLNKEELEYEIRIRGVNPQGTVKELLVTLKQLLSLEQEGHSFTCTYQSVATEELIICKTKLTEIRQYLSEEFTYNLSRRIQTKLAHVLGRIEHIVTKDPDGISKRSELLSSALECLKEFEAKKAIFSEKSKTNLNPLDILFQSNVQAHTSTPIKDPVSSNISQAQLSELVENLSINNKINISNWGLKFSGESDALCLNAFLVRVNELRESRGLTTQQLFRSAVELFEGRALIYFRAIKDKVSNWDELCDILRDEFLPRDFNDRIWEQIKSRTQGDRESIAIYVAYMNNLFSRLTITVDESIKLKIIRKNILPFYQNQLLLVDINSLEDLIDICRKIEDNRKFALDFVPPSLNKNSVETDLAYKEGKQIKGKIDNMEAGKSVSFSQGNSILKHDLGSRDSSVGSRSSIGDRSRYGSRSRSRNRDSSCDSRKEIDSDGVERNRKVHRENRYSSFLRNMEDSIREPREKEIVKDHDERSNRFDRDSDRDHRRYSRDRSRDYSRDRYNNYSRGHYQSSSKRGYRDFSQDRNPRHFSQDRNQRDYSDRNPRDFSRDRNPRDFSRDRNRRDYSRDRYETDRYNSPHYRNRDFSRERHPSDKSPQNYSHDSHHHNSNTKAFNQNKEIICYKCKGKNHFARNCTFSLGNARRNRF